jgi:hypothetical protein
MGFIGCILLLLVFENEQQISQIFDSGNTDNFKVWASKQEEEEKEKDSIGAIFDSGNTDNFKVWASKQEEEEEEDSVEAKICNKLFDSETCENIEGDKPDKELTEEEIKAEAIINRYLEPVESETKPIDNTIGNEVEIANGSNNTSFGSTKPFR